jgi:glutathione S-transferase
MGAFEPLLSDEEAPKAMKLRFAEEGWREGRPALAAWYEAFSRRPSMQASDPTKLA